MTDQLPSAGPERSDNRCPICTRALSGDDEQRRYAPFCSKRCQQVDLVRWMDGRYAVVDELFPDDAEDDFNSPA